MVFTGSIGQKCNLGDVVRHRIHGLTGVVSVISYYLNGCVSCGILPLKLKDGKAAEWYWADQIEWIVVKPGKFAAPKTVPGGPMPTPPGPERDHE